MDPVTGFLALAGLLLLSIATISLCKQDAKRFDDTSEFLFEGKTAVHSFVSSVGAVFSVTYFFGATFIYASIYNLWTLVIAALVFGVAFLLFRALLRRIAQRFPTALLESQRCNLLLELLRQADPKGFPRFARLLFLTYYLLLVEELAISRVVISQVFPGEVILQALLLFVIAAVILAYLYIGGFRAVLNSDLVQGFVLLAFVTTLLFYVFAVDLGEAAPSFATPLGPGHLALSIGLWAVYGLTWLLVSVDFFARLNFEDRRTTWLESRYRLTKAALAGTFVVLAIGIVFAYLASPQLGEFRSANDYYQGAVSFFGSSTHPPVVVIFLISIFCMIFTGQVSFVL